MKQGIKLLFFLLVLVMSVCRVSAGTLLVGLSPDNNKFYAETILRINRALASTGYDFEVIHLPRNRLQKMLLDGDIAMEMGRGPDKKLQHPDVIQLQPPVIKLTFSMVASIQAPQHCHLDEAGLADISIVGLLGSPIFKHYYAPKFAASVAVKEPSQMFNMVILRRADVAFMPLEVVHRIPAEIKEQLIICGTHLKEVRAHSYLHKNFLWARDAIEAAYRREFEQPQ